MVSTLTCLLKLCSMSSTGLKLPGLGLRPTAGCTVMDILPCSNCLIWGETMNAINIGLGNFVSADRVVAIVSPESAPIKRMVQDAKDKGTAIDSTYGRRTRGVLIMDSGQLVLSSLQPSTIVAKNTTKNAKEKVVDDDD